MKPNRIDEKGNDCIHLRRIFTEEEFLICSGQLPDCVQDCKWVYIDHDDEESIPQGEMLSRIIWFCSQHKSEIEF